MNVDQIIAEAVEGSYGAAPNTWKDQAQAVVHHLAIEKPFFTSEDVWATLEMPDNGGSALGGVMRRCAKHGWIELTGETSPSTRELQHKKPVRIWRSKLHPDYVSVIPEDQFKAALFEVNDEIQKYVSNHGINIPNELLKMLSDLDWLVMEWEKKV